MKKGDLVEALYKGASLPTKKQAGEIVDWFFNTITASLKKGEPVEITGFGSFKISKRAARAGRNPKTGAAMQIKASKGVKFKAGALLKAAVK
jgi:nucleoid DNA-binding protein